MKPKHIHFLGIGGIGMSGLALILAKKGFQISGCDNNMHQPSIRLLKEAGCSIMHGNNSPDCDDNTINALVYSSAIHPTHPEIIMAQSRLIPTISRAQLLATLMRDYTSIAIAGTHGKTTTTSLISHLFIEAQKDPTIIVGGHLKNLSSNARVGTSPILIAEADESDKSLAHLFPTHALITNIDIDHVDTYSHIDEIKYVFTQFISHIPWYGSAIICYDDPIAQSLIPLHHTKTITYGTDSQANIYATDIEYYPEYTTATIHQAKQILGHVIIPLPGYHNLQNALGAITMALNFDISFPTIQSALPSFKGIERRFSFLGSYKHAEIFEDYGHHPIEIHHTLNIACKRAQGRIIVLFQPHRYTRTQYFWQDFIHIFATSSIDALIITDIYAAHETPIADISSQKLATSLANMTPPFHVNYLSDNENFTAIKSYLDIHIQPKDLILLLGAGNIHQLANLLF